MNSVGVLVLAVIVVVIIWLVLSKRCEGFSGKPPLYGWSRYGYPYSYYGTWYRPQGYWGPSYYGDPYGYGTYGYGGKQQNVYCRLGCLQKYQGHCKEKSILKCSEKLQDCLDLCDAHAPYYKYDRGY